MLEKVKHFIPMGSLKKIKTLTEFYTWYKGQELIIQWKLDGISIELIYVNGKFLQAITRGDGITGEDVTHTICNAQGFPKSISEKSTIAVRCEALLFIKPWKEFFKDKVNPRNAVSGLVRRLDAKGSEHITCIAFDTSLSFKTELERIRWLEDEGFHVTTTVIVTDIEEDVTRIKEQNLSFQIDGAVIKVNSDGQNARAWKFGTIGEYTTLENVSWTVGVHGTINPIANVFPVFIDGVTIQNITLHNIDEIERLGIKIGDTIEVIRAGSVIPKITKVLQQTGTIPITLNRCPVCSSDIFRKGPHYICIKKDNCPGALVSQVRTWIKKRKIMFLGDITLNKLIKKKLVTDITSLYSLTIAQTSIRIYKEIKKSRTVSLADFIGSLSINLLGQTETENIISHGIDTLNKWRSLTTSQIMRFPDFQEVKAFRISRGLADKWPLIERLSRELKIL